MSSITQMREEDLDVLLEGTSVGRSGGFGEFAALLYDRGFGTGDVRAASLEAIQVGNPLDTNGALRTRGIVVGSYLATSFVLVLDRRGGGEALKLCSARKLSAEKAAEAGLPEGWYATGSRTIPFGVVRGGEKVFDVLRSADWTVETKRYPQVHPSPCVNCRGTGWDKGTRCACSED